MARVVVQNLVKEYGERSGGTVRAVNGISLSIEPGEFMVLVGPSGCGKSTTLRMIAGLEEATSGSIEIDGRSMNDVAPKDRDIAMVFQNYALYPHMSVYDNMAFGLKLRRLPKSEIDARVREAAALLGLENYLARRPKALSGGQRQRVAVGRAIVRKPKVFLFDEPLSNLDAKMRASTRAEISRLHARLGATMIYVTHDQAEAMTMGDRICVMRDGDIMQVAEPLELYRSPKRLFVAGFIGSPPMNLLAGTVRRTTEGTAFMGGAGGASFAVPISGAAGRIAAEHADRPIVLGVRPEDIHDAAGTGWTGRGGAVRAGIELAEPMGAETHVHLKVGGSEFLARMPGDARYPAGSGIDVIVDVSRAYLFDPATGESLCSFRDAV